MFTPNGPTEVRGAVEPEQPHPVLVVGGMARVLRAVAAHELPDPGHGIEQESG
ncbi:hypothetical protein GCM10010464_30920 [Pseudonocardia yunnanensis]